MNKFERYLVQVAEYHQLYRKNMRIGQAYYNCLPKEIADDITGTELDPFHMNANLPQFLAYVALAMED